MSDPSELFDRRIKYPIKFIQSICDQQSSCLLTSALKLVKADLNLMNGHKIAGGKS